MRVDERRLRAIPSEIAEVRWNGGRGRLSADLSSAPKEIFGSRVV